MSLRRLKIWHFLLYLALFCNSFTVCYAIDYAPEDQVTLEQVSFTNSRLEDVLADLSDQADVSFFASPLASNILVSLNLPSATPMQVVDALVSKYDLWYQKDFNASIVRVHSNKEPRPGQLATEQVYSPESLEYPADQSTPAYDVELINQLGDASAPLIAQIEFKSISVGDALRILSEQSGINVIASEEASRIPVTMFLRDITAMEVIDAISKTYNLWYQRDRNTGIVRMYTVKEYRLERVDFKKEDTEVFTMKNAKNALDFAETIQNLFGYQRVNLSFGQNPQALLQDLSDRFQLFDMIDGRTSLVQSNNGGGNGNGNGNGNNRGRNNNNNNNFNSGGRNNQNNNFNSRNNRNFQRNTLGNQNNVALDEYLETTDKVIQRLNENKKGQASLSNLMQGNQDYTRDLLSATIRHQAPIFVGVISRQNRVLVRTRDSDAMAEIRRLSQTLNTESSMLMMEVKILSIDLTDGFNSLFDFKLKSGDFNVSTLGQTGTQDALTEFAGNALTAAASTVDPTLLATVVSKNFEARLELFEQEGRVTELATPLLLTSNQEVSKVFVGEERPITTGFSASTTRSNNLNISTTNIQPILVPDTELRDIGTTLLLTPNINADKTVSIRVLVEQSTIGDDQATIPVPLNNRVVDTQIDVVQERTFSGTVVASDMQAIAVGGLIEEGSGSREKKVPVLGDIPLLGFFFKENTQVRERKELVVIIKPYIMTSPDEAEPISRHILANNSIHPDALDHGDHMMDIYKNDRRNPKGYELQPDYKLYEKQDAFDKYHGKGSLKEEPTVDEQDYAARNTYVELTQYAAKAVRLPLDERQDVAGIEEVFISNHQPVDLLYDTRIRVIPVTGWRKGGVNVTAFELHNTASNQVNVDYQNLKGQWLASTIEDDKLSGQNQFGDSTYLYLISAQSFDEISSRFKGGR